MDKCKWCGAEINIQCGPTCVSCWSLETRIAQHPEIADRILNDLKKQELDKGRVKNAD